MRFMEGAIKYLDISTRGSTLQRVFIRRVNIHGTRIIGDALKWILACLFIFIFK